MSHPRKQFERAKLAEIKSLLTAAPDSVTGRFVGETKRDAEKLSRSESLTFLEDRVRLLGEKDEPSRIAMITARDQELDSIARDFDADKAEAEAIRLSFLNEPENDALRLGLPRTPTPILPPLLVAAYALLGITVCALVLAGLLLGVAALSLVGMATGFGAIAAILNDPELINDAKFDSGLGRRVEKIRNRATVRADRRDKLESAARRAMDLSVTLALVFALFGALTSFIGVVIWAFSQQLEVLLSGVGLFVVACLLPVVGWVTAGLMTVTPASEINRQVTPMPSSEVSIAIKEWPSRMSAYRLFKFLSAGFYLTATVVGALAS